MRRSSLRIRELPDARLIDNLLSPDWIEIKNLEDLTLDLSGIHLSDNADAFDKWSFPEGTTIEPSGFKTVFASGLDLTDPALDEFGLIHSNFRLSDAGESLLLSTPDDSRLDEVDPEFPQQYPDVSYGRTADNSFAYLSSPTLGEPKLQSG